jgi:pyridoxal phosphate enzyme (YggS family)
LWPTFGADCGKIRPMTTPPPSPTVQTPLASLSPAALQTLRAAFEQVRGRILAATAHAGREPGSVTLLAVTKTFGPEVIAAAAALGQRAFGENYVQEAVRKMERLDEAGDAAALQWHFIGPIQSNKTRLIAQHFAWVQSVERASIAQRLSAQRPPQLPPLQVLLEVNISAEQSKSGAAPPELVDLAQRVAELPQLSLRGLMAIPRPGLPASEQRATFARLRDLFDNLRRRFPTVDTLSMGMSADFEDAIAEGSTMVRVGSALFGERR